ncbi:MAG TPA: phosphatidylglycerophosphatase A [Candidatus Limnocylindria bacterium]|jgi:phosphatidylglycerophosphatase A|nr:phosphatidylglycerophosphatase A [Candidatus Limnocylindria bacterium]
MKDDSSDEPKIPGAALLIWVAQGFGSGRIPFAPGTWGSVVGIGWYWALAAGSPSPLWFFGAALVAVFAAVSICGQAEVLLKQHDPSSVVLDEIVALPWCFCASVLKGVNQNPVGSLDFFKEAVAGFVLFRFFDVIKPPPIRQLQKLPGGLGVVIDDVAAALATALCLWILQRVGVL